MITVGKLAESIAPLINLSWPNDRDKIFNNLSLVEKQIWASGKFHESTRWFHVNVDKDNSIITPHGYNVLLAVDVNKKPQQIRDQYFLFHKNGPGDVTQDFLRRFDTNVYDLGSTPVLFQPTDDICKCKCVDKQPKLLSVKADCSNYIENSIGTRVSGLDKEGRNIWTYKAIDNKTNEETLCCCTEEKSQEGFEGVIEGVRYPISSRGVMYKNILFSQIRGIVKEPTKVPIEYYAVHPVTNTGVLIARLEPNQIFSRYRKYMLSDKCKNFHCVLGLFKKSEPDPIITDEQTFISSNILAINSLAIAMDYKYEKKNMQAALPYLQDAAVQLNAEVREHNSGSTNSIQVVSHYAKFPKL